MAFFAFFGLLFARSTVRFPAAFLIAVPEPVTAFFLDFVFTVTLELLVDFFDFTVFFAVFFALVAIVTPSFPYFKNPSYLTEQAINQLC